MWLLNANLRLRQVAQDEARKVARVDALTSLPNRRAWDEALPRELARARRDGKPFTVAMIDLDNFKKFNDTHGHQAGDDLLADAARAWIAQLRETDLLARYGGEEFIAALPDSSLNRPGVVGDFWPWKQGRSYAYRSWCWKASEPAVFA